MVIAKLRYFFEGAGIALLLFGNYLWPTISPFHIAIYHYPDSASAGAAGLAIDLVIASIVFALVFAALERRSVQRAHFLWAVIVAVGLARTVDFTVFLLNFYHVSFLWTLPLRVVLFCGTLGFALMASQFLPRRFDFGVRVTRTGFAVLGCCILWMLPQLISIAVLTHGSGPAIHAFERPVAMPSPSQNRVIWILLDELSYDQVYQHRQNGVALPHFDALKGESVVFSNVAPEGYYTERILPALLLNRKIDDVRSSLRGDLYVHEAEISQWRPFREDETIFGQAKRSGWTTGVVGWYNPYCHILRNVLDSCYWQLNDTPVPKILGSPVLSAAAYPFDSLLSRFRAFASPTAPVIEVHIEDYTDLIAASRSLIQNEGIDFVFLHLPIPHPPGIYDRKRKMFGVKGSYLDNLVLADKTVGDLLSAILSTASAGRTTLIISSDHSWRVPMWRVDPSWSAEEERASGGKFDPRPFLLIRFPKETSGEVRTEAFPELGIDGILRAMVKSEIRSRGDLDQWLATHEALGEDIAGTGQ